MVYGTCQQWVRLSDKGSTSPLFSSTKALSTHKEYDFLPVLPSLSIEWFTVDDGMDAGLSHGICFGQWNVRESASSGLRR